MEEMPNSICGNTAVGGNYNSTCDSIGWHFERDINTGQYIAECSRKDGNSDLIIIAHLCACDSVNVEDVEKMLKIEEE